MRLDLDGLRAVAVASPPATERRPESRSKTQATRQPARVAARHSTDLEAARGRLARDEIEVGIRLRRDLLRPRQRDALDRLTLREWTHTADATTGSLTLETTVLRELGVRQDSGALVGC